MSSWDTAVIASTLDKVHSYIDFCKKWLHHNCFLKVSHVHDTFLIEHTLTMSPNTVYTKYVMLHRHTAFTSSYTTK